MTRREGWLVALPTAVVAVSWWVIETLVPNLLPIPARWAWTVVGVSAAAAVLVLAMRAAHSLRRRRPGPWIARPFGRSARWMRERPRLSILLASASATFGISTLDALTVHLTVHRNVARSRRLCVISFEDAVLTLVQRHRRQRRVWRLRPVESGGFLSQPLEAGRSDNILIVFAPVALPLASAHAPDLNRPYSLVLDLVEGTLQGHRPVSGRLPKAKWESADFAP